MALEELQNAEDMMPNPNDILENPSFKSFKKELEKAVDFPEEVLIKLDDVIKDIDAGGPYTHMDEATEAIVKVSCAINNGIDAFKDGQNGLDVLDAAQKSNDVINTIRYGVKTIIGRGLDLIKKELGQIKDFTVEKYRTCTKSVGSMIVHAQLAFPELHESYKDELGKFAESGKNARKIVDGYLDLKIKISDLAKMISENPKLTYGTLLEGYRGHFDFLHKQLRAAKTDGASLDKVRSLMQDIEVTGAKIKFFSDFETKGVDLNALQSSMDFTNNVKQLLGVFTNPNVGLLVNKNIREMFPLQRTVYEYSCALGEIYQIIEGQNDSNNKNIFSRNVKDMEKLIDKIEVAETTIKTLGEKIQNAQSVHIERMDFAGVQQLLLNNISTIKFFLEECKSVIENSSPEQMAENISEVLFDSSYTIDNIFTLEKNEESLEWLKAENTVKGNDSNGNERILETGKYKDQINMHTAIKQTIIKMIGAIVDGANPKEFSAKVVSSPRINVSYTKARTKEQEEKQMAEQETKQQKPSKTKNKGSYEIEVGM